MTKPRVAVIGGGIFGVSCALELSAFCDVTLFERRPQLMEEGSYGNQYRHHYGYHYPRSPETVRQCLEARTDFEQVWGQAIKRDFPAYYAVAKQDSKITPDQFVAFCRALELPYSEEWADASFLNPASVDFCVRTDEPVYDYEGLRRLAREKLAATASVVIKVEHTVLDGKLDAAGKKKILTIKHGDETITESFDGVVNATYANYNVFCNWFGFPMRDLEFRLKEIVVVRLPTVKRVAVTIIDGPFVTLVPLPEPGLFTLGDVPRSIRDVRRSAGGVPWTDEEIKATRTRFAEMKEANARFIPIVAQAEYVRSMFSVLPVEPTSAATDARTTDVVNHGNGCWSVFEGKIITSVSAAKRIARDFSHP